jgi:hypothetical protein
MFCAPIGNIVSGADLLSSARFRFCREFLLCCIILLIINCEFRESVDENDTSKRAKVTTALLDMYVT